MLLTPVGQVVQPQIKEALTMAIIDISELHYITTFSSLTCILINQYT